MCGPCDVLDALCAARTAAGQWLEAFGCLEWDAVGSGCFLNDPADDGWGQMCRLGVIESMSKGYVMLGRQEGETSAEFYLANMTYFVTFL